MTCGPFVARSITPKVPLARGYRRDNRPLYESGFDLNRWTWQRKRRVATTHHIVTPSRWLGECARECADARLADVRGANCLDTERWAPGSGNGA